MDVRKTALDILHSGRAAHLGSAMSMVEMLVAVYASVDIERIRSGAADRDRVIISKGHSAAAVYATMAHYDLLSFEDLPGYYQDGSLLAGHVSHGVPHVEHSTGALGHGLSVAAGCALGLRSRGFHDSRVFAILGDGEVQEGAVWEALMFARHHRLSNLVTLIDDNRISSITDTAKVIDLNPMADRFGGFGLRVHEVDGHDVGALRDVIAEIGRLDEPSVILCRTVKGYGVPFAEGEPIWHYRSLSDANYETALLGLGSRRGRSG